MLLLDTCALIYWTLDRDALSIKATQAIQASDRLGVSSISIWEIGIKARRGKLVLPLTLSDYVERLNMLDRFEILPVDERIWIKNIDLEWTHKDPADRTIVATAILLATQLVTSDDKIRAFYSEAIW